MHGIPVEEQERAFDFLDLELETVVSHCRC